MEDKKILETNRLTKKFGKIKAVDNFTFRLDENKITGVIGPNGAGKTTLINLISGHMEPAFGEVYYKGNEITALHPHKIARMGIGRTFQVTRLFKNMTVFDHLLTAWSSEDLDVMKERASELLDFLELTHLNEEKCKNLSGGQQRLMQLASALMIEPDLLLLDEPFYGIAPPLRERISDSVKRLVKEENKTFLIISHDVPSLMKISDRMIAMSTGKIIATGSPKEVRDDEKVKESYLGL